MIASVLIRNDCADNCHVSARTKFPTLTTFRVVSNRTFIWRSKVSFYHQYHLNITLVDKRKIIVQVLFCTGLISCVLMF